MTTDLKLEPDAPKADRSKVCGDCVWFAPYRGENGRVHPSKPGQCEWPRPEIKWPIAYRETGYFSAWMLRRSVWKATDCSKCPQFNPK